MFTFSIIEKQPREALCATCVYEVVQKGFKGEKLAFCSYGGGLRELKFKVCECTCYVEKGIVKPEKVIGFIRPGEPARAAVTVIRIK